MNQASARRVWALAAVCHLTVAAMADDWPQWLGPNRDSVWGEPGIVESFKQGEVRFRWRTPIGSGYSGPAVAGGRVYLMDRVVASGTSRERVLCLEEAQGKPLWEHSYECAYTISYAAGPRTTPSVSDGKVYTLGAEGNLFCLDATNGAVIWSHDFKKEFSVKAPVWGFAGHPLVDGPRLICIAAGNGTTVVAYDKNTGKELWRSLSAAEPGYSAPMIFESGGARKLIIGHAEAVNSLQPETGRVNWSVPFAARMGLLVASPRKLGDLLFFTSFYDGSLAVRLDPAKPGASVAWQTPKGRDERNTVHLNSIICTPFLEDGLIYGVCSYGQLRCLRAATGERLWESLQATTGGGPVRWANAFIVKNGARFFLFNEKGDLIIARLSAAGYEEISRAHLLDPVNKDPGRAVVWSHPAFANRRVYARNDKEIVCADLASEP